MKIFWALFFLSLSVRAELKVPPLTSPVVDQAGLLSYSEQKEIENWLLAYRQQGKAQIQVVIIPSLDGMAIEDYSLRLVDAWRLGSAKKDDGVLLLISVADRRMRIEVGQGLEGALSDLYSRRILDDRVRPLFKAGQYAAGVASGVQGIIEIVDPEYAGVAAASEPHWQERKKKDLSWPIFLVLFFFFIFIRILGLGGGRRGFRSYGSGTSWGTFGGRGGGGWSGGGGGFSGGGSSSNW